MATASGSARTTRRPGPSTRSTTAPTSTGRRGCCRRSWPRRWRTDPGSERVGVQLPDADAHGALQRLHEDLAVADLAGVGRLEDRLDHRVELVVGHRDLELDLGQEVDHVLGPAVKLGVALLAAEPLDLGNRDAGHAGLGQRFAHVVEFERLDDRHDHLHHADSIWAGSRITAHGMRHTSGYNAPPRSPSDFSYPKSRPAPTAFHRARRHAVPHPTEA